MSLEAKSLQLNGIAEVGVRQVVEVIHPKWALGCANVGEEVVHGVVVLDVCIAVNPFDGSKEGVRLFLAFKKKTLLCLWSQGKPSTTE